MGRKSIGFSVVARVCNTERVDVTLIGAAPLSTGSETLALTSLSSAQARLVFARLAVDSPRPVPSDELANCLWPHHLPSTWRATLRGVVARVRRWLSDAGLDPLSAVESTSRGYRLCLPSSWSIDVREAVTALAAAEQLSTSSDHASVVAAARRAGDLTALEFLPEHEGEWTDTVRRRFRDVHCRALEIEADALMSAGRHGEALAAVRKLVTAEPFSETARQRLIRLLSADGDRSGALAAYDEFASLLTAELGVVPSAATRALRERILEEDRDAPSTPTTVRREGLGARDFVGRTAEIEALDRAWERARVGHATLVLIAGEAGIGKSSLAAHAAKRYRDEGATLLVGHNTKDADDPFEAFVEAIELHADTCSRDDRNRLLTAAGPALAVAVPSLSQRQPGFGDPPTAAFSRHATNDAVCMYLRGLADTCPTVLLIDDVQWATEATLSMLRRVVHRLRNSPVLVVLLERRLRDAPARGQLRSVLAELQRDPGLDEILLGGLSTVESEALARMVAGSTRDGSSLDVAHLERVRVRCGGNPFFMRELLKVGADLDDDDGQRRPLPNCVTSLIDEQCCTVGQAANTVLRALAVTGSSADRRLVQYVADLDDDEFLDAVDEAHATGLLRQSAVHPEHPEHPEQPGHLAYSHALAEESVYSLIPPALAARLHRRAGAGLEELRLRGVTVSTAELARHLKFASTTAAAERATSYVLEAAAADLNDGAREAAISRLRSALAEAPDAPARSRILLLLGKAQQDHGDGLESRGIFLEAARLAGDLGDWSVLAEAALGLNGGGRGISSWEADPVRIALLEAALGQHRPDSPALQVKVMAALSETITTADGWTRRQLLADEALAIATEASSTEVTIAAFDASRIAWWRPDQARSRLEYADRVIGLLDEQDRATMLHAMLMRLADLVTLGDRGAADAALATIWPIARSLGQPRYVWDLQLWEAGLALNDGRLSQAAALAEQAAAVWGDADHPDAQRAMREQVGLRMLLVGDGSLVVEVLTRPGAIPSAAATSYRCVLTYALVLEGRHAEASSMLDDFAANDFRDLPQHSNWLFSAAILSEAAAVVGSPAAVDGLRRLLRPYGGLMVLLDGPQVIWGCVDHHLGTLAARARDHDESAHRLRQALVQHREFGAQAWAARTAVALGGVLVASSLTATRDEGNAMLTEGARIAGDLGLTRLASAAHSIAHRARPIDFCGSIGGAPIQLPRTSTPTVSTGRRQGFTAAQWAPKRR